jgi:hypothetical protein
VKILNNNIFVTSNVKSSLLVVNSYNIFKGNGNNPLHWPYNIALATPCTILSVMREIICIKRYNFKIKWEMCKGLLPLPLKMYCDEPLLFNTSVESKVIQTSHDDRGCYALSELYIVLAKKDN